MMATGASANLEGLNVRAYRDGDDDGLLDLFTQAFGTWPRHAIAVAPIDHLRWKLLSDLRPDVRPLVAELDGRIVAATTGFVQRVSLNGVVRSSIFGAEEAVLPEYQGAGIMSRIRQSGGAERKGSRIREVYFGIESPHVAMPSLRKHTAGLRLVRPVDVLGVKFDHGPADASGVNVRGVSQFDERVDALWRAASKAFQFAVVRTRDYLNWRYCDLRAGLFGVLLAEDGKHLLGYAVYRRSFGKGDIADLFVLPERLDAVDALVGRALGELCNHGIESATCWSTANHPYRQLLEALGFRKKRRAVQAVFRNYFTPAEDFAFFEDEASVLHVMAGDSDVV